MKWYLDEDLAPQIAARLRARGIDVLHALDAGNVQLSDSEQLRFAAAHGRCLVTRNARHFVLLAQASIARQEPHAGIVLCPSSLHGFEIGKIVAAIVRMDHRYPKGLGPFDVVYL
jgi:predicted nuclease of predicted toxin-antitoxin system